MKNKYLQIFNKMERKRISIHYRWPKPSYKGNLIVNESCMQYYKLILSQLSCLASIVAFRALYFNLLYAMLLLFFILFLFIRLLLLALFFFFSLYFLSLLSNIKLLNFFWMDGLNSNHFAA